MKSLVDLFVILGHFEVFDSQSGGKALTASHGVVRPCKHSPTSGVTKIVELFGHGCCNFAEIQSASIIGIRAD